MNGIVKQEKRITLREEFLPDCFLTSTGLELPETLSHDLWSDIGSWLQKKEAETELVLSAIRWAMADWLRFGEHKWGEKYAQAVEVTNLSGQRLANLNWVAGKYKDHNRRRPDQSIEHHIAVASLPPEDADALLEESAREQWSASALYAAARAQKATNAGIPPEIAHAQDALCKAYRRLAKLDPNLWPDLMTDYLIKSLLYSEWTNDKVHEALGSIINRVNLLLQGEV